MKYVSLFAFLVALTACATPPAAHSGETGQHSSHDEPRPFVAEADAKSTIDSAIIEAAGSGKKALIVMGANWCHDSRGLAAKFEAPRFQSLIDNHYVLRWVDVGKKDKNIDQALRFGLDGIKGTPTVLIIDSTGTVLNLDTAPTWRNAASRTSDETYNYFAEYAEQD